jgi:hypothetical protein
VISWPDRAVAPSIVNSSVLVGDGPANLKLHANADQTIDVYVTGMFDDSISVLTFDSSGNVLANTKTTLTSCGTPTDIERINATQFAINCSQDSSIQIISYTFYE